MATKKDNEIAGLFSKSVTLPQHPHLPTACISVVIKNKGGLEMWWDIYMKRGWQHACLIGLKILIGLAVTHRQCHWLIDRKWGGRRRGSRVPIIAQQLPSSETWPIKTAWDGDTHTHTHYDVDASSGHGSILVSAGEGPLNTIATQLFGFGGISSGED